MSKLNKLLAMSLTALTLAGPSSQVFATRHRRPHMPEAGRANAVNPVRREADFVSAEEIVEKWFNKFKRNVGNSFRFKGRAIDLDIVPSDEEANAAMEMIKTNEVNAIRDSVNILLRLYNNKKLETIIRQIKIIMRGDNYDENINRKFDFIGRNYHIIRQGLDTGYYHNRDGREGRDGRDGFDFESIAQSYLNFHRNMLDSSRKEVADYILSLITEAKKQFKDDNYEGIMRKFIEELIESKKAMPAKMKVHVKRIVNTGSYMPFLEIINEYADAL